MIEGASPKATRLGLFALAASRHAVAAGGVGKKRRRPPPSRVLILRALPAKGSF